MTDTKKVQLKTEPAKVKEEVNGAAWVIEWPRAPMHYHTYGLLTPYFKGLTKGELMATRCMNPKCPISKGDGLLWIPPRADCPDCHQPMEWVKMDNPVVGEVYAYTWVERGGEGLEIEPPYYQIDIALDGVTTIPKGYLVDRDVKLKIGDKVKACFRTDAPTNTCLDIYWTMA
jgi:uncharacterized OB-fold protein